MSVYEKCLALAEKLHEGQTSRAENLILNIAKGFQAGLKGKISEVLQFFMMFLKIAEYRLRI